jgi:hypothetical protein
MQFVGHCQKRLDLPDIHQARLLNRSGIGGGSMR